MSREECTNEDFSNRECINRENIINREFCNREYIDENNNIYVEEEIPYEEQSNRRGFFLSSLSIDEKRLSVLIICLIMCMIFGGVNYVLAGDITNNLMQIILTLIYAIAGVNITNSIVSTINNRRKSQQASDEIIVNARNADETVSTRKKLVLKKRE